MYYIIELYVWFLVKITVLLEMKNKSEAKTEKYKWNCMKLKLK